MKTIDYIAGAYRGRHVPVSLKLLILLMLIIPTAHIGWADDLYVQRIGIEQGLSQNNVTAIAQDQKGFMWFGTQIALNRYDGYTFKAYTPVEGDPNSLSSGGTWALLVDSKGVLWAGTYKGLNRYREETDDFISYQSDPNNPNSLSHANVWALHEDSVGNLWVGTGEGLNRFDREQESFTQFLHDDADATSISSNFINAIYQDRAGVLWVATDRGLNRYHSENQNFESVGDAGSILRRSVITSIAEDAQGRLWVGTNGEGVFIIDQSRLNITQRKNIANRNSSISSDKIKVIIKDKKDRIWLGTDDGGLNIYNEHSDQFSHYKNVPSNPNSLSENNIFSLYEDDGGVLWIGTYTQGLSKLNPYGFSLTLALDYQTLDNPDPHTDIRAFLLDRERNLWVGSSNNGIRVTSPNGDKIAYRHNEADLTSLASDKVYTITEDSDGVVWVGTANGWLHEFDRQRQRFIRYQVQPNVPGSIRHGKILAIAEDSTGLLWVGIERGAAHSFDRNTKKFTHFHHDPENENSISFDRIFDIHIDARDDIWFATYGGGLSQYDRANKKFTNFLHNEDEDSIGSNYISCLHEDEQDSSILWLGAAGAGLSRFDTKTQVFKQYSTEQGLADNVVYGIVQEGDNLWLSHNKGLSRFNKKSERFHNYAQQDGLQHDEFNGGSDYKDSDGKLYLGGIAGYNAFYPEQIIDNPNAPRVYITELQLFNKVVTVNSLVDKRVLLPLPIESTDELTLSYKDTVFSFGFAALDYASSEKNQYAYRMEGLETDWNFVDSRRRFATYTTLSPGDYTFRVKASNNNGVWNETGASLKITITPPFWQTWWFRIVMSISVIAIVFFIYAARVKAINERNKILKEQVKEATSELQKEKSNLEATLIELGETKDALIEAAHKAGMADTATGVLHNVGNLLNSVNTSSGVMRETIETSVAKKFLKGADLLVANKDNVIDFITNDAKGSKLINYFMGLIEPFKRENATMLENVMRLNEKISAISETIAAQQVHAKGGAFVEVVSLAALVDDSIALQTGSINRHEIKIERVYDAEMPKIKIQKTKLVQIIINLFKNAKESMDACQDRESVLKIEIKQDDENAYITFTDNGLGVEKDKLQSIFAHGFTTKANGHGFGLHSCANYMSEMGGRLWAESEGLGKGVTFIASFPLAKLKADSAAASNEEQRKTA